MIYNWIIVNISILILLYNLLYVGLHLEFQLGVEPALHHRNEMLSLLDHGLLNHLMKGLTFNGSLDAPVLILIHVKLHNIMNT